jgi:RNA polymerase sigma-70 factor (ECF subfamily)
MVRYALVDIAALSIPELLVRCIDDNSSVAWEEFVRRFQPTLAGTIYRTASPYGGVARDVFEDLVQDCFVRLCARRRRALREFQAADSAGFYGLLRATAIAAVHDHFRRTRTVKRHGDAVAQSLDALLNETIAAPGGERNYVDALMLERIDEILREGDPEFGERNRLVFWLHHRDGLSAAAIARLPWVGLKAKGVETLLLRLRKDLGQRGLGAASGGDRVR